MSHTFQPFCSFLLLILLLASSNYKASARYFPSESDESENNIAAAPSESDESENNTAAAPSESTAAAPTAAAPIAAAPTDSDENENKTAAAVSAVLVFGDSAADPGNNNYILTAFKGNFVPYGKDFLNHKATGRFSNGRLTNDFIAEYVGVKEFVPPYLDPTLSNEELMSGVSFASAGSGYDPLTSKLSHVIPMTKQLEHFQEYKTKLVKAIGESQTDELINNALFIVSAGTYDLAINYFVYPFRRLVYTVPAYTDFMLQETGNFLQKLTDLGARRIGVTGLPPLGCLPIVITTHSKTPITNRECLTNFSSIAQDYNNNLQNQLNNIQAHQQKQLNNMQANQTSGPRIAYLDIYKPLEDVTLGRKHEFEVVDRGCCGTGLIEMAFLCNPVFPVCKDADKSVFWDAIHPSEKSNYLLSLSLKPTIDNLISE